MCQQRLQVAAGRGKEEHGTREEHGSVKESGVDAATGLGIWGKKSQEGKKHKSLELQN